MLGHRYTPAEYTLQQIVESFAYLFVQLEVAHSTHTYWVVYRFCELENINYLVLRYLNPGALPFEDYSKEWSFDGEG
jgi:hypothetical protein